VIVQEPAAMGVTVALYDAPTALSGPTLATLLQVSVSLNVPL
jgi:hypothetical protein